MAQEDLDDISKALEVLDAVKKREVVSDVERGEVGGYSLSTYIQIIPIVLTIVGAIFITGIQTNKWNETKETTLLEVRAEIDDRFLELAREAAVHEERLIRDIRQVDHKLNDIEMVVNEVVVRLEYSDIKQLDLKHSILETKTDLKGIQKQLYEK